MNIKINIPKEAELAISILNKNGFEAYIVGGCVRDSIIGIEPSDWDITTSALPNEIVNCFEGHRVIETGIKHGTVTVIINKTSLEITTYRIDGDYKDNRRPEYVQYTSNIKNDLERRDFTINAMAYNDKDGLIDLYGGIKDIEQKIIRCVGDPDKRFNEDGLRILRALRFASVLGFEIENNTSYSIIKSRDLLTNIALERINVEFNKLIVGCNFKYILHKYSLVVSVFIPEIELLYNNSITHNEYEFGLFQYTLHVMSNSTKDLYMRLAIIFNEVEKLSLCDNEVKNKIINLNCPIKTTNMTLNIMRNLKYDNETIHIVRNLVLYCDSEMQPTSMDVKAWLNKTGIDIFKRLLVIKKAYIKTTDNLQYEKLNVIKQIEVILDDILEKNQCYSLKGLAVNGDDLLEMGILKGKHIGEVLNELLNLVINEKLDNKKELLINYIKSNKKYLDSHK